MTRFPFSLYTFSGKNDLNFCQTQYSQLKYGSDIAARKFGKDLAEKFFEQHYDKLLSNHCVVIPSPYNHVQNAASVLTKHFVNRLNQLLVGVNGNVVEATIIHRKVNYTMDYGFLQQDQREHLINNDAFYFNEQFIKDKFLIFVDDIKITGAHERRMIRLLNDTNSQNDCNSFSVWLISETSNLQLMSVDFSSLKYSDSSLYILYKADLLTAK